jgi:hypothetical protein
MSGDGINEANHNGAHSSGNGHFPRPEPQVKLSDGERKACAKVAALAQQDQQAYKRSMAHWRYMAALYRRGDNLRQAVWFETMANETERIVKGAGTAKPRPVKPSTRWQTVEAD